MMIKPYGDTLNDGAVQLSFTLPVPQSNRAREAACLLAKKMGFDECEVVHSKALSDQFTFFIVYGKLNHSIDFDQIHAETDPQAEFMDFDAINLYIKNEIGRKIVIVGACTGFDAHTVGIDAIMNMKGYNHHYGLERYPMIEAHNLGAQVENSALIEYAVQVKADAILISQVVTQKECHLHNLTQFNELLEAENLRERFIVIAGGPRISNRLALEIGFDAGFGRGTYPEHVATFVVKKITQKT